MKKRKNFILYSILSLAVISLITVGFSSFILDGSVKDDSNSVKANIGTVIDKTIIANIIDNECDYNISFDNLKNGNGNITNNSATYEDLSFKIVYTLERPSRVINKGNFKVNIDINDDSINSYNSLVSTDDNKKFIDSSCLKDYEFILPNERSDNFVISNTTNITTKLTYESGYKKVKIETTYNFKWGEKFKNQNPAYSSDVNIGNYLNDFINKAKSLKDIVITITPSFIEANI